MNFNSLNQSKGFTIVELLIVIVIIGILAALVIVSYTGIQDRAKNTQIATGITTYIKALSAYAADNGSYPGMTASVATGVVCMNGTTSCWAGANSANSTAFKTGIDPYMNYKTVTFPSNVTITWNTTSIMPSGSYTGYYLAFVMFGNDPCPNIGGATLLNYSGTAPNKICRVGIDNP